MAQVATFTAIAQKSLLRLFFVLRDNYITAKKDALKAALLHALDLGKKATPNNVNDIRFFRVRKKTLNRSNC